MKRLLIAFMLIVPFIASAKIPDEEDIKRKIFDPESKYYYTNLMMRYNNLERLNDEEYHYLYYGYAYHELYKPTASNPSAIIELLIDRGFYEPRSMAKCTACGEYFIKLRSKRCPTCQKKQRRAEQ